MIRGKITHKGKTYEIKEPTVSSWAEVMRLKDILDEEDIYVKMIETITGLSKEQILESDASTITQIGAEIYKIFNQESKELFPVVEYRGEKYKLVDMNNISFGQYVDIDSFLRKDESYRITNLNELAAYLYTEEGVEYGKSDIKKRIEDMKDFPIKYVESSLFFLLSLTKASQGLIQIYSRNKFIWKIMRLRITLMLIGDGIKQYRLSQKTKFGRLMTLLLYPFLAVSITFRILLTKTGNKKG
jgi:hypothetical protein